MSAYNVDGINVCPCKPEKPMEDLIPDRLLIWHDEFDSPYLDTAKWETGYGISSRFPNMSYVKEPSDILGFGNSLSYKAIKDNPNPDEGIEYSSSFIWTKNKFEFRYGRIEAKIRFPNVSAHHSTFWTLGANTDRISSGEYENIVTDKGVKFPSCGEIDIAEFDNGVVGARTHWATNGFDTDTNFATGGNINSMTSTPSDWHIYACEWTADSVIIYVDGVKKTQWNTSASVVSGWNPFQHPHMMILNCVTATSGTITWDYAQTNVAWVRVYAPIGVTEIIEETGISIDSTTSITVGQRKWLEPSFTPINPSDMTLRWHSHNPDIVTCYGGMLIGVSAGTTYVQCMTKNGFVALCKVTVT